MSRLLLRYQTKPGAADQNAELIRDVFKELAAAKPDGVRYLVLRNAEGMFFHFVASESEAGHERLTNLPAFEAFADGNAELRIAKPERSDVTVVGDYRMLADQS